MLKKLDVMHGVENVASNASTLANAEREIGLNSKHFYTYKNVFGTNYKEDIFFNSFGIVPLEIFYRFIIFFWALFFYDVIHLNFGSTIFPNRSAIGKKENAIKKTLKKIKNFLVNLIEFQDLRILKAFKKKIFVTFQGDDGRLSTYHNENFPISHCHHLMEVDEEREKYFDELKKNKIKYFDKYADEIFSLNPDILHNLPNRAKFLPYSCIDLKNFKFIKKNKSKIKRIIHAPSNPMIKGTKFVLQAIKNLKEKGYIFEFELITNLPRKDALEKYKGADLLIDQLLVGWYGGLAVENMAYGTPVIAYLRENDLKYIPKEMADEMPIINASPFTIEEKIEVFLKMSDDETDFLRKNSRGFIEKYHDPLKIANFLKKYYLN